MQNDNHTPCSIAAKGNPRAASVRIKALPLSRARSQRTHDLRIGRQPNYVDDDRCHLNRVLMPLRSLPAIHRENEVLRDLRGYQKKMKSNAAAVMSGIITFGHQAQVMFACLSDTQQDAAYSEVAERVAELLQTQLESLVVHGDESADHAHFMLRGYCDDGQPVSKRATYKAMSQLQDIAAEVMQQYCPDMERGHGKWDRIENGADYAETINRSVKQLHRDLPTEIAAKNAELQVLVDEILGLQASIAKTQRHFEAMEARRNKTAKQLKTARTYKNRLATKEAALSQLVTQCGKLRVELDAKDKALKSRTIEADDRDAEHAAQVLADADRMALETMQIAIWNEDLDAMTAAHTQKVRDDTAAAEARDIALRRAQEALDAERLVFEADLAAKAEEFERQHGEIEEAAYLAELMRFYAEEAATEAERKAEMANLARLADEAASEVAQSMAASAKIAEVRSHQQAAEYVELATDAEAQLDILVAGHSMVLEGTAEATRVREAEIVATAAAKAEAAAALVTRDARLAEIRVAEKIQQKRLNERAKALDQGHDLLKKERNKVAVNSRILDASLKGIKSIFKELNEGTLTLSTAGGVGMKRSADINAAPNWVQLAIAPIVQEILGLRQKLQNSLTEAKDYVGKLEVLLQRDDLTIDARAEAEELHQVDWLDGFDDLQ